MKAKYLSIYDEITEKIKNKEYKPRTILPSENDLMNKYSVSRDTIRKALTLLEQNGYIQKIKGKGSLVLEVNKFDFPVSGIVSFKELADKMGLKCETIVEKLQVVKADKLLIKNLNLSSKEEAWQVIRVREIDGERVILDKDFINKKYVASLTEEICKNSIYEYIENELGLQISFAKKEITVEEVTEEDTRYLDLENHHMIVVVRNYVYLNDASLFQYTESRHRTDKFRFVDFARRNS
ncbi:trehalose operon repressor [Clostridium brassicae]|uniref:Trehalose operon repressor n=1 Tax=Clostridium brassicae TaxID=2999072 RepID=A0ABT4DGY1_9CLOT|nr:trehalose operon repressor [Clostridium brassicae]MCY6960456.1 trehalose operon repressor [Clostridium brassicae]